MNTRNASALLTIASLLLSGVMYAQTVQQSNCSLSLPDLKTDAANIFDDRQEQDLGDALAEMWESQMHIAAPAADDQLTKIGRKRLLTVLPPSGIRIAPDL